MAVVAEVAELYGLPLETISVQACRTAQCPYMGGLCDGGGNRDMARVRAADPYIGPFFDRAVGERSDGWLPCGVCSVHLSRNHATWAICPRRLLAFDRSGVLGAHAKLIKHVFQLAGYRRGDEVDVWSEVSLSEVGEDGAKFDFRLDYVLRKAKPESPPVIVEVMTCSTYGGSRLKGTDIQGAFRRAVVFANTPRTAPVEAPGVNVRQVWARMASQLIAKSQAANSWGGRTIWVGQDLLADFIRLNTALPLDALRQPDWNPGEVNLLVADLSGSVALYAGPICPSDSSRACWMELLGAPRIPTLRGDVPLKRNHPWIDLLGAPHRPTLRGIEQQLATARPIGRYLVP